MPEAIATTKRKFYKALDALTTTTHQVKSQRISSESDGTNKRPLSAANTFDEARERVRKRLRQSISSTSLAAIAQASSTISLPHKSTVSTVRPLPLHSENHARKSPSNFSPWSHDAFLARLKTFSSVSRWHPKPEPIGEVEWAKRGWTCVDTNTVACCGGCERRVVVDVETSTRSAKRAIEEGDDADDADDVDEHKISLEDAFVERYKEEIVDGHAQNCLWHRAGCKDDVYRLQVVRPAIWQPELRKRFQSLLSLGDALIGVKTKPQDNAEQSNATIDKLLRGLPEHVLGDFEASSPLTRCALRVALHGWQGSSEAGNQLLHCGACFQRIGLWMYQPGYRPSTRGEDAEIGYDDEGNEQIGVIDLVEMHREHCPWRNSSTQHAIGSLSGLNAAQILQRVATTCARDHRRRSNEQSSSQDAVLEPEEDAPEKHDTNGAPKLSREEIAAQDRERESRLRKLKKLFNFKRRPATKPAKAVV